MKTFTQVALPHKDVLEGTPIMDIFAADLWQVTNGKAPVDYQDPDLFFKKTYMTKGLKNIIEIAKKRLEGKGGDAVIQLQTPFGGGKTHTLIALYHKAKEWNAKVVVIDGTALNPLETKLWEEIERQLANKVEITKGNISPGKEKLIKIISENFPVLILIDELLEYLTRAAGVKVGDTNLASQTLAFLQELTGAVSALRNALLVITLPSSTLEHYDENAERAFQQLQKITGRTEKIYTPVEEEEIEYVIRKRLFENIDEKSAKEIVDSFIQYTEKEGLLSGEEAINYKKKFLKSYPFKPEVIDVLYKRWGSFPTFQRTRGVLRLLSLVIHDLLDKHIPFIRLGDFNLENDEIKRELIKHIGQEWDSILSQDITSKEAGAKRVDKDLGISYKPYKLGTVVSTTIFMLSFSGKGERKSTEKEIKLSTALPDFSSALIDTVINKLREKLFYLSDEGLYFTNVPNLNKILVTKEENISKEDILKEEKEILESFISKSPKFKVYIYPKFSKDIPDIPDLKLVILNNHKPTLEFLSSCGELPRRYRNTLVFLCTDETQKVNFHLFLRKLLALKSIIQDKELSLTENQQNKVKKELKDYEGRTYEELRKYYRIVYLPAKNGYRQLDMGLPTFGEQFLDEEIYNYLRSQGEILERISPKVIKEKYLSNNQYVELNRLFSVFLQTPGEIRLISKEGFIESIKEGVQSGLFGLGIKKNGSMECNKINEIPIVNLSDEEVIINPEFCKEEEEKEEEKKEMYQKAVETADSSNQSGINQTITVKGFKASENISKLYLKLGTPIGQISTIARIANYLNQKFKEFTIEITLKGENGEISRNEFETRIIEALNQANIQIKEKKME